MKKVFYRLLSVILCLSMILIPKYSTAYAGQTASALKPAFPGAEGFGAYVTGGRGGEVYHVTTLADNGPGSFRDAVTSGSDTNAPRTVVFDVSGYIDLKSAIQTSRSNLTIAGQTAPGDGITVRWNTTIFENASNIIVRNMRFRNGHVQGEEGADDAAYFHYCNGVIIDHCTYSWGTDENISIKECRNVTLQWSLITESILPHSMGSLIEWNTISMHHNLYAHNNDRNPKSKGNIDFVNNVVYDWGVSPMVAGGYSSGFSYVNVDSNYFIPGASTVKTYCGLDRGNSQYNVFLNKNLFDNNLDGTLNGKDVGLDLIEKGVSPVTVVNERYNYPEINTEDATSAFNNVLNYSGASLHRDAIDRRVTDSVRNQTGTLIPNKEAVGGYCELVQGTAAVDTDKDGMPDDWEKAHGLNPNDASDGSKDTNGDGYTNLEDYLNGLVASEFPDSTPPATLTGAPSEPDVVNYKFDFGSDSSPVTKGFTRVSGISLYSTAGGYGFGGVRGDISGADRGMPDILKQDFCSPSTAGKTIDFKVDVPNGRHYMKMISGDYLNGNNTTVSINTGAATPLKDTLVSNAGAFAEKEWYVDVTNGQIDITLGGNAVINSLEVSTVPSNLKLDTVSENQIKLSWNGINTATNYNIYRSYESDYGYKLIDTSSTTDYADNNVTAGEKYYYRISANTGSVNTEPSEALSVSTVDSKVSVPNVPGDLKVINSTADSVNLSWSKAAGALRYDIYRADAADGIYHRIGSTDSDSFTDSIVTNMNYYYKIAAANAGGESAKTDAVESVICAKPVQPSDLNIHYSSSKEIYIKWNSVNGAIKYNIYRSSDTDAEYLLIGSADYPVFIDNNVAYNKNYSYKVTALNQVGESDMSDAVSAKSELLEYKFDFGMETSDVAEGYTQIYPKSTYYNSPYGFTDITGVDARDRGSKAVNIANDFLRRDFVLAEGKTFLVDVPNGYYLVDIISGDGSYDNETTISVENGGAKLFKSASGEFSEQSWIVKVEDGHLNVNIGKGGRINGMTVNELADKPDGLKAAGMPGDSIVLSWNAVKNAESYNIYKATVKDSVYSLVGTVKTAVFRDSSVLVGEKYYYTVSAVLNSMESAQSDALYVSNTDPTVAVPQTPSGLIAGTSTPTAVQLSWNKSNGVLRYKVYRADKADGVYSLVGTSESNSVIDSINTDVNYFYKVSAVNAGGESGLTEAVMSNIGKVPEAPANLVLHSAAASGVYISWFPVASARSYNIFRASVSDNVYRFIGASDIPRFIDSSVIADQTYSYKVTAVNIKGQSDLSDSISATTQLLSYKFDFGDGKSPADGYIQITIDSLYNLHYGFNDIRGLGVRDRKKPADNVLRDFITANGKSFLVDVPNGYYSVSIVSGDASAANKTTISVENGNTQQFNSSSGQFVTRNWVVKVEDGQLNVNISGDGRINGMAINELPGIPEGLNATDVTTNSATLVWDTVNGATAYNVYRSTVTQAAYVIATVQSATYTNTSLIEGNQYFYKITAINANGESLASEVLPVVAANSNGNVRFPAKPDGLIISDSSVKAVSLSWNPARDAQSYNIYRSTVSGSVYSLIGTSKETEFKDVSVEPGSTYYYRVAAVNSTGISVVSSEAPVLVKYVSADLLPDEPKKVTAASSNSNITLEWKKVKNASAYNVYRSVSGSIYSLVATVTKPVFSDTSAKSGTTYSYRISAVNTEGISEPTDAMSVMAGVAAAMPDITDNIDND